MPQTPHEAMQNILSRLKEVKQQGKGYIARCPAHDDHNPSLSISLSGDSSKLLIKCFAGCADKDILDAVGLKMSDLFINKTDKPPDAKRKTQYSYYDVDGKLLYTKFRVDRGDGTKYFYFLQPDGTKGVKGVKRVPYNLSAVLQADKVYFVEGEKCAEAVIKQGCVATTLDSGSNSRWLPEYAKYFEGKQVTIIPDNDKPGIKYAQEIAKNIPHAVIKQLPGLAEKEDIFDWLAAGHTMTEVDALSGSKPSGEGKSSDIPEEKSTQAETLLKLCGKTSLKIFLDETNELYAAAPVSDHTEIFSLESRDFSLWLQDLFYSNVKRPIRQEFLSQVINTLSAQARFGSKERIRLFNRVALCGSDFWYDLCNTDGQAVKVSANGWEVRKDTPILFHRYRHQKEQVLPRENGDVSRIFRYVNVKEFQMLFLCWLITCFVPEIPHPMPIIYGEKGAAKSTACALLKQLIDPSATDTLTLQNDARTLVVNLQQHFFLPFDNVSVISGETSDMLCRAITGGSVQQRRLCTNAEDYIFTFMRCLAINGINNVANRSDLLDRSLLFELERVSEGERKERAEVYRDFEADRPIILGGIFDTLSAAMARFPTVKLDKLPRMADFCRWGYAVAETLGGRGEQFLREYTANYERQNIEAIEADSVATLIIALMTNREQWCGRVSDLLVQLVNMAQEYGISKNSKSLPSQPNVLSRRLNGIKSNLKAVGITFTREAKTDGTYITLKNENSSPLSSYHVDSAKIMGLTHGDAPGDTPAPAILPPPNIPIKPKGNGDDGDNGDNSDGPEEDDVEF